MAQGCCDQTLCAWPWAQHFTRITSFCAHNIPGRQDYHGPHCIEEQIEYVIPGPQDFLQRHQWMISSEQHQTTRESNWFWGSSLVKTIEKTGFRPFNEWKILKARTITAKDSAKTSHPAQKLKLHIRVQYSFTHYVLNHLHEGLICRVHCELPGRPIIIFR